MSNNGPFELSRPLVVESIPAQGKTVKVQASDNECIALAQRLDLQEISALSAEMEVTLGKKRLVRVRGEMQADVTQTCVVTLAPVKTRVSESFDLSFSEQSVLPEMAPDGPEEVVIGSEDLPDPIVDGVIDLGEVVAEQLALALDPFPRSEEAGAFEGYQSGDDRVETDQDGETGGTRQGNNPFAVLEKLKNKDS